jgi:hypothetical protein
MEGISRAVAFLPWGKRENSPTPRQRDIEVARAAAEALGHIAVALSLNFAVTTFVAVPVSITLATSFLTSMILTLAIELGKYAYDRLGFTSVMAKPIPPHVVENCKWYSKLSITNILGLSGPVIAAHETGHFLVAKTLYSGANPSIKIFPFQGGVTLYNTTAKLSTVGALAGARTSVGLLMMGGIIASVTVASTLFATAQLLKERSPALADALQMYGLVQLLADLLYGISSILDPMAMEAGDFCLFHRLSGIHPGWIVTAMLLIPLGVHKLAKKLCEKPMPKFQLENWGDRFMPRRSGQPVFLS